MGLLCCFAAPATAEDTKPVIDVQAKQEANEDVRARQGLTPAAATHKRESAAPGVVQDVADKQQPWAKLNENESAAVKQTLLKVRPRAAQCIVSRMPGDDGVGWRASFLVVGPLQMRLQFYVIAVTMSTSSRDFQMRKGSASTSRASQHTAAAAALAYHVSFFVLCRSAS